MIFRKKAPCRKKSLKIKIGKKSPGYKKIMPRKKIPLIT